ncbi:MAG: hypothetical protein MK101_04890 [Phycisphaerales bacterium]|nr:hypothetical protein [Phycisphaerales bacterium]
MNTSTSVLIASSLCGGLLCSCTTSGPQLPASAGPDWPADWSPTTGHPRPSDVPYIDVSQDNVPATWHCEATIIDTRSFADQHQLRDTWTGTTQRPGKLLRPHKHQKPPMDMDAEPNTLRAGGLTRGQVTDNHTGFASIAQTPWTPPDPSIAVGPDHVLTTVNMAIAWYDREGNEQFSAYLDNTGSPGFFEDIGAGGFTFDPKCFYDPIAERFVVLALEWYDDTEESWITFAVSDDADPNGIWFKYRTWSVVQNGSETHWVDYPGFGYDEDAYYVTGNLFGLGSGSGWGGVLYRVIEKAEVLAGDPATIHDVRKGNHGSVQCTQHHGDAPRAFFVSNRDYSRLRISSIADPTNPTVQSANVSVPSWDYPSSGAPNPGGEVSTLDGRILNAHWREGSLYTCHAIDGPSNNTVSRWYEVDVSNPSSPSLVQSGDITTPSGVHNFFPAIGVNSHGDVSLVMAMASSSDVPSVQVTGRQADDPLGTMGALHEVATGTHGADGRYGDYYDMTVDPIDDTTFWYIGEYSNAGGWQAWVGSFTITEPDTCPVDLDGDGQVGVSEILTALAEWGGDGAAAGIAEPEDIVDVADILGIIAAFGPCP